MSQHRPPRLTLARLLTLPVIAAITMAVAVRSDAVRVYGLPQVILIEAIFLPLGWAIVAQVVVRRGRARERTVSRCLVLSATAVVVALLVLAGQNLWDIGAALAAGQGVPIDLIGLTMAIGGGLVGLVGAYRVLLPRVIPVRCPNCGDRALFPDGDGTATDPGRSTGMMLSCEVCGSIARRRGDGGIAIDEDAQSGAASRNPSTVA